MYKINKYYKPKTISEAAQLLQEFGEAQIIAGGTDSIPGYHHSSRRFQADTLIDIGAIAELREMISNDSEIMIGAGTSFSDLLSNELVRKKLGILADAVSQIGSVQIRNRATIGGNISNNAPCADSVPPLLALGAKLELTSWDSKRIVELSDFLKDAYNTDLRKNEILTKIIIDLSHIQNLKGFFYKLGRRRGVAVSRLTFACLYDKSNGILHELRFAVGAITPIGKRFREIEEIYQNKKITSEMIESLIKMLADKVLEISGLRWSTLYKLPVLTENISHHLKKHLLE